MQSLCTLRNHRRRWPRNTRYQADATPYLGRSSTGWIAPALPGARSGRDVRFIARPPPRSVRAAFPHTACMGLSLSRVSHIIFRAVTSFFLFDPRREHSSVPTAYHHRRRAQRRSRTALQRRRRLVLDQREHGGRLPVIGWLPRDDPRGACHWPRAIAREPRLYSVEPM
jgi:hypothetical protein